MPSSARLDPPVANAVGAPALASASVADSWASDGPIVLFDGVCNLCNGAVTWLLEHDARGVLRFGSLQSPAAVALLAVRGAPADLPDSIVLLDATGVYVRSEAALRIAAQLGAPWSWLTAARVLPRSLRDATYAVIARNRYRWFGKRDQCMLPDPAVAHRFLP